MTAIESQPNSFSSFARRDLAPIQFLRAIDDFEWYFKFAIRNVDRVPPFDLYLYNAAFNLRCQLRRVREKRREVPRDLDAFLQVYDEVYDDWKRRWAADAPVGEIDPRSVSCASGAVARNVPLRDPFRFPANSNLYKSKIAVANAIALVKTHADKVKLLKRKEWNRVYAARRRVDRLTRLLYLQAEFAKSLTRER